MAQTTGLWQSGQEEALQNYLKAMINGCNEVCKTAQNIASKVEGKDKNNDTTAVVSIMEAIVGFCNGQVDMIKETVGEIIRTEKNLEEEKGSQCGYADATQAVLNQLEKYNFQDVNLEVGGLQLTQPEMSDISASFHPLRDAMSEVAKSSKVAIEGIADTDATFTGALEEIHKAMHRVFIGAVEMLNDSNKNFAEIADDVNKITTGFKGKAEDTAQSGAAHAMDAASVRKSLQPAADSIF